MLSRSADHLYWMARYMERAENTARILEISQRMALLPHVAKVGASEWRAVLKIAGDSADFTARYGEASPAEIVSYMTLDPLNPSSIYAVIRSARENARAERVSITSEMWESLNATWIEVRGLTPAKLARRGYRDFFDWIKERSHLFRGIAMGTMMRDQTYDFIRLGTFIERADKIARILDVKYHVLLPSQQEVGGAVDHFQWGALLRSVSAFRAYHKVYHDKITPWRVAELLVLNASMPRSLHACHDNISEIIERISGPRTTEAGRLAGEIHASLHYGTIEEITKLGLHQFLTRFVARNNALSSEIRNSYLVSA